MLRVEAFPEADTPGDLRTQVRQMQEEAWPSGDPERATSLGPVHDPALCPLSMLLIDDDTVLAGTVLVGGTPEQPFASDQPGFDKVTLGAFFSPQALQARRSMLGARVRLHCGEIDRLW